MANVYQNWKFRADIKITNPSSTEGVQAKFSLPWYPGMRGNFRDIRVSDKFGNPLSFWIESHTEFSTAEVWVKLPANDSKIFLHYGNGSAVSESDGDATFELFDDFSGNAGDPDSEKWAVEKKGSIDATVTLDGNGNLILSGKPNTVSSGNVVSVDTFSRGIIVEYRDKISHVSYPDTSFGSGSIQDTAGGSSNWYHPVIASGYAVFEQAANTLIRLVRVPPGAIIQYIGTVAAVSYPSLNTYYSHKWEIQGSDIKFYRDGTVIKSASDSTYTGSDFRLMFSQGEYSNGDGGTRTVDYIRIRKYVATEPTLALSRKIPTQSAYVGSPAETSFTLPCDGLTLGPVTPTPNDDTFPIPTITELTLGPVTPNFRDSMHIPVGGLSLGPASPAIGDVIPLPCSGLTLQGGHNFRDTFALPCDGLTISALSAWSEDYTGLDLFDVESLTISRSISDSMWQLSAQIAGRTAPDEFQNLNWSAVDNDGAEQHIFAGVITESGRSYAYNGDSVAVTAYDYSYYLGAQKVPPHMLVMDLNGTNNSWHKWIEDLIEDTGIVDHNIRVSGYHENNVQQVFTPKTSKLDAIQKICELTGFIFYVAPVNTGTTESPVWRAGAYFIDPGEIDEELDLPAPAVITYPDPTLVGIPSVTGKSEERINRVTVRGVDDDGNWFTAIEESANVTSGEAYPREYYEESANWDTQAKCDYRAQRIYAYFNIGATTINATFIKRFDLRLWQKISFTGEGFDSKITTLPPLRIVSIQYSQALADETVSITCIPDRDLNLLQLGTTLVDENNIDTTESVVNYALSKTPTPVIGTVLSIDGNVATVRTEDGRIIDVRIVS